MTNVNSKLQCHTLKLMTLLPAVAKEKTIPVSARIHENLVAVIDELPPRFRLDRSKVVVWILELGTEALRSKDAKLPDLNSVEMAISRQPKDQSG